MNPKIRSGGHFHRWITPAWILFITFVCASCATEKPYEPQVTAQEVVFRHAESAFEVWFDRKSDKDRTALNRFFVATEGAETRTDLTRAWAAIPDLAKEHPDFLDQRIFSPAARDGDWPGSDPPLNQKVVFVDGVRQALMEFLGTGG